MCVKANKPAAVAVAQPRTHQKRPGRTTRSRSGLGACSLKNMVCKPPAGFRVAAASWSAWKNPAGLPLTVPTGLLSGCPGSRPSGSHTFHSCRRSGAACDRRPERIFRRGRTNVRFTPGPPVHRTWPNFHDCQPGYRPAGRETLGTTWIQKAQGLLGGEHTPCHGQRGQGKRDRRRGATGGSPLLQAHRTHPSHGSSGRSVLSEGRSVRQALWQWPAGRQCLPRCRLPHLFESA